MIIKDITSALSIFEEYANIHAEATQIGDYKSVNKAYKRMLEAVNFLRNQDQILCLSDFLYHPSVGVKSWSATYLLYVKEKEAVKVLEEIVRRNDIHSLNAATTLSEWRKGNLKL